jgi:hypothetical protein
MSTSSGERTVGLDLSNYRTGDLFGETVRCIE